MEAKEVARVRPMEERDMERVAELSAQLGYPAAPAALEARRARLAAEPAREGLFVCEDPSGRAIGWVHVQRRETLESEPCAEICGLVVGAAEAWALARGLARVRRRSSVARLESHAFYAALGYARAKTQHVYERELRPLVPGVKRK